ncbi:hypothetical protein NL676_038117 [Syzygium grande]|nr:hypothetical protein NL676_038117 [Syzygium grande]
MFASNPSSVVAGGQIVGEIVSGGFDLRSSSVDCVPRSQSTERRRTQFRHPYRKASLGRLKLATSPAASSAGGSRRTPRLARQLSATSREEKERCQAVREK